MAAITPTSGSQAVTQMAWQQLSFQQARRNAERAEQVARSLQAQATDAQRVAERAAGDARSISAQSVQAQAAAARARQGLAVIKSVGEMQGQLSNTVSQVIERFDVARVTAGDVPVTAAPVVNSSGQVTGTVVNTTA